MALLQGVSNAIGSPAATQDGQVTPYASRMGRTNELYVGSMVPTKHLAALAGMYYCATAGATLMVTNLTTLTEASPLLIIENAAQSGGPNLMLDYVRIKATAVTTLATDFQYSWKTDTIRGKWGSAGSALTPQNSNMGALNASAATVHFGALVVATAQQSSNNARVVQAGFIYTAATAPVQVLGDTVEWRFGSKEAPLPTVLNNVTAAGAHTFAQGNSISCPPVILPPGTTATLFLFGLGTNGQPSYELNMGWFEW